MDEMYKKELVDGIVSDIESLYYKLADLKEMLTPDQKKDIDKIIHTLNAGGEYPHNGITQVILEIKAKLK